MTLDHLEDLRSSPVGAEAVEAAQGATLLRFGQARELGDDRRSQADAAPAPPESVHVLEQLSAEAGGLVFVALENLTDLDPR